MQPLVESLGLKTTILPTLRTTDGYAPPQGWAGSMLPSDDPAGGAYVAGRVANALSQIQAATPGGRVVVCTHGDTLPVYVAFMTAAHGLELPPLPWQRGAWYTFEFESDGRMRGRLNGPLEDFPL